MYFSFFSGNERITTNTQQLIIQQQQQLLLPLLQPLQIRLALRKSHHQTSAFRLLQLWIALQLCQAPQPALARSGCWDSVPVLSRNIMCAIKNALSGTHSRAKIRKTCPLAPRWWGQQLPEMSKLAMREKRRSKVHCIFPWYLLESRRLRLKDSVCWAINWLIVTV